MKLSLSTRWHSLIAALVIAAVVTAGCSSDRNGGTSTVTASPPSAASPTPEVTVTPEATGTSEASPTATAAPSATRTAVPTATPGPPRLERFAAGETIDVAPAVVFVDPETGVAEAWVIPGAWAEFGVSPSGSYIVYQTDRDSFRLLRTDDGSDRSIGADSMPIEYGPGDSGFVATTQGRFVVSVFDGQGDHVRELWLGGVTTKSAVSWSPSGSTIAFAIYPGSGSTLEVSFATVADGLTVSAGGRTTAGGVSLKWSHDGARVAVVTTDHVRVVSDDGGLVGEFEGEFGGYWGNPRWSTDDSTLYVSDVPRTGGEYAYLFGADVQALFRFFSPSYEGGCAGEQWNDGEVLEFGNYDVSTDGRFEFHDRTERDFLLPAERFGVILADGLGFHGVHYGAGNSITELPDGRRVFTTPSIGHGGCGEAWRESPATEPQIDRPPYGVSPS